MEILLECQSSFITVVVPLFFIPFRFRDELSLNDRDCRLTVLDEFIYYNITEGLESCGGERVSNGSHIVYKNSIRDKEKTANSVVERAEILIPFECSYESEIEVNLKNAIEPTKRTIADLTCREVRDRSPKCQKVKKYCQAPKYVVKMKQNCKSTCGFCRKTCKDANKFACTAERSRCFSDREFAEKVCPATCGLCDE